jgi:hypothetical protein
MLKDRGQVDGVDLDGLSPLLAHQERIAELEEEITQLRVALAHRQRYGVVTGVVAVRYGISPERAWQFLVRLSQQTNLKIQVIARIIHDRTFGRLAPEDEALAARLDAQLCGELKASASTPAVRKAHGERR